MIKDRRFILAVFLIFAGVVILLLKAIVWVLGLIPVLAGIVFFFISRKGWLQKLALIFGTVVLTFCSLVLGAYLRGDKAFEEIHFSNNFRGRVRILYSKDCGINPLKHGDWAIIEVDTNSILLIRRAGRRVYTRTKFFLLDDDGGKTEIESIGKLVDFKGKTCVLNYPPLHFEGFDANVQDYTLLRKQTGVSNKIDERELDSLTIAKLRECQGG